MQAFFYMSEESSQTTKRANKLLMSIYLAMKAKTLDTHTHTHGKTEYLPYSRIVRVLFPYRKSRNRNLLARETILESFRKTFLVHFVSESVSRPVTEER